MVELFMERHLKREEKQEKVDIEEKEQKRLLRVKVEKLDEDRFSLSSHQIALTLKDILTEKYTGLF